MNPELIAVLGVGIAVLGVGASLAALIVGGQRSIRSELAAIRADLHVLGERVARLEGAFPFISARRQSEPEGKRPA